MDKFLDLVPSWIYAAVIALLLLLVGVQTVRLAGVETEFADFKTEVSETTRKLEVAYRAKEQTMRDHADRIANEQAQKESELAARAARAELSADGLRDDIARLNAGAAPADPATAALVGQARTARKLLGACANEYRSVAHGAEQLRVQVIGLQAFVADVCRAPN